MGDLDDSGIHSLLAFGFLHCYEVAKRACAKFWVFFY